MTWRWGGGAPPATLTAGESLRQVVDRIEPLWLQTVQPALAAGRGVLVVAHGDSLRAFRAVAEGLTGEVLGDGSITPAQPLVYRTDSDGRPTGAGRYVEDLSAPPTP